jgi:Astacin (Peptidase family M12A)
MSSARYDRDMYVDVQWENIKKKMEHNFKKHPRTFAFPKYGYDFSSVMQYRLNSFGINGRPTMVLRVRLFLKMIQLQV